MKLVLCIFCLMAVLSLAVTWSLDKSENEVYGGWLPSRRSSHCVPTGGQCMKSYQCCHGWDICYISPKKGGKYAGYLNPYGECRSFMKDIDPFETAEKGFKKAGEPCSTSSECIDQCCKIVVKGRLGTSQICGKPGLLACVGDSTNSIYGY